MAGGFDIRAILDSVEAPKEVKARAWDDFYGASGPEDFKRRFDALPLPREVKARLWDGRFQGVIMPGPVVAPTVGPVPAHPPTDLGISTAVPPTATDLTPLALRTHLPPVPPSRPEQRRVAPTFATARIPAMPPPVAAPPVVPPPAGPIQAPPVPARRPPEVPFRIGMGAEVPTLEPASQAGREVVFRGLISPEKMTEFLAGGRTPKEIQEELANPNIPKARLEAFLLGAAEGGGNVLSGFTSPFNIALVASGAGVARAFKGAAESLTAAKAAAADYSALRAAGASSEVLIPAYQKAVAAYETAKLAHNTAQVARIGSGAVGAGFVAEGTKNFAEAKELEGKLTAGAQILFGAAGVAGLVRGPRPKFVTTKPPGFRPARALPAGPAETVPAAVEVPALPAARPSGETVTVPSEKAAPAPTPPVAEVAAKEPWEIPGDEYANQGLPKGDLTPAEATVWAGRVSTHARVVERAVSEGKPVPPEVLKDYPDLARKYAKPSGLPKEVQPKGVGAEPEKRHPATPEARETTAAPALAPPGETLPREWADSVGEAIEGRVEARGLFPDYTTLLDKALAAVQEKPDFSEADIVPTAKRLIEEAKPRVPPTALAGRRPDFEHEQELRQTQTLPRARAQIEDLLAKVNKSVGTKRLNTVEELRNAVLEGRDLQARIEKYEADPSQRPVLTEEERDALKVAVRKLSEPQVIEAGSDFLGTRGLVAPTEPGLAPSKGPGLAPKVPARPMHPSVRALGPRKIDDSGLHNAVRERKSTIPILQDSLAKGGELYSTDLEVWVKTKTDLPDGMYQRVGNDLQPDAKFESANFPVWPELKEKTPAVILNDPDILRAAQSHISKETSRYELNGALIKAEAGKVTVAATDGHRLIAKTVDSPGAADFRVLVPSKALAVVGTQAKGNPVSISVGRTGPDEPPHIIFRFGGAEVISRNLTGTFPNYEAVLPREASEVYSVNRAELTQALKTLIPFADSRRPGVIIEPSATKWRLTTGDKDRKISKTVELPVAVSPGGNLRRENVGVVMSMRPDAALDYLDREKAAPLAEGFFVLNPKYLLDAAASGKTAELYLGIPKAGSQAFTYTDDNPVVGPPKKGERLAGVHPAARRVRAKPKGGEPAAIPPGPGARTAGATGEGYQGTPLEQLGRRTREIREAGPGPAVPTPAAVKLPPPVGEPPAPPPTTPVAPTIAFDEAKVMASKIWEWYKNPYITTDYKRAIRKFSGAELRSSLAADEFAEQMKRAVPDPLRQEAILNWIEAEGDGTLLRERAAASAPDVRPGYEAALTLTGQEKTYGRQAEQYWSAQLERGQEAGILEEGVKVYVTHVWNRPNAVGKALTSEFAEGRLQPNFKFAKQRVFASDFEGEQAGFRSPSKSFAYRILAYNQSFERALYSRALIKTLLHGKATDGRPVAAVSGKGVPIKEPPEAQLVKPHAKPEEIRDYKEIPHHALRKWKWVGKDAMGRPTYLQGDIVVHPEVYRHLRNVLGKSGIREWELGGYHPGRAVLRFGAEMKQVLLSFATFHQVTIGVHGLEHRANAFHPIRIDLTDPDQAALVDAGWGGAGGEDWREQFMEGVSSGGLIHKIPLVGPVLHRYTHQLFGNRGYVRRVGMTMALHALRRNRARYEGKMTEEQILWLTADQSNAAFGMLNYTVLGRNKTLQDVFRLLCLAPNFTESRARFTAQALRPHGREQLVALLGGAVVLYTIARLLCKLGDNDWHWDRPFNVVIKGHEYSFRSIQGDILHLYDDARGFLYNRMNPTYMRPVVEALTGRDRFGKKRGFMHQFQDWLVGQSPIPIQGFLNPSRDYGILESALGAIGAYERKFRTRAERLAREKAYETLPLSEQTREQEAKGRLMAGLTEKFRTGEPEVGQIREAIKIGKLTPAEAQTILRRATSTQLEEDFKRLPIREAAEVWIAANAKERQTLRPLFLEKATNAAKRATPSEVAEIKQIVRSALGEPVIPAVPFAGAYRQVRKFWHPGVGPAKPSAVAAVRP